MNKQLDLSLYLVLDPILCGGIDKMIETTRIAVKNGVTVVQLRSEHPFSGREWYDMAKYLKELLTDTTIPLIINDKVDIALAVDADGVHVGQNDLAVQEVRRLIGPNKFLGLSVNNNLQMASTPWGFIDYIGIGPIFSTKTKKKTAPCLGLSKLKELSLQRQKPAVAIGGIKSFNAYDVLHTNVNGIAVVSAICGQKDIAQATQKLKSTINFIKNKEAEI